MSTETIYDPAVALAFFKSTGSPEAIAQGKTIFAENDRNKRMYLLLKGSVDLLSGGRKIGAVKAAEIFGELAMIDHQPRSATAVAAGDCRVIGLDEEQFMNALRLQPAFALMLMSTMIHRLRLTIGRLAESGALAQDEAWKEGAAFKPQHLRDLARGLTEHSSVHYREKSEIIAEGQMGTRMYAVLEGRVAISIGGRVVEKLGPGGVFGEAALVNQKTRMATAVAEVDCMLLPIPREAFLHMVKLSPKFADTILTSLAERLRFLTARLR
jgi:CRP/FNR family transcriptional regulator, cyclic AMP receptor protein